MRKILLILFLSVSAGSLPVDAGAEGCLKGAAVGGVVGHLAGHHAVTGAVMGCALGHHRAKVKEREKETVRAQVAVRTDSPEVSAPH